MKKKLTFLGIIFAVLLMTACGSTVISERTYVETEENFQTTETYTDEYIESPKVIEEETVDTVEDELAFETSSESLDSVEETYIYTKEDLKSLKNTDIFLKSAIEHIFLGNINKKGAAGGYHSEVIEDSPGEVVEGTRTEPDSYGVYSGKVTVNGQAKQGNKGYSTFFPSDMSPQEVVDAICEAYEARELISGNLYSGLTDEGMEIDMALTDDGKIITAYPVEE